VTETDTHRSLTISRVERGVYVARNADGDEIRFGEQGFSPVELLMAALAGCTAIGVDLASTKRVEPEHFDVRVDAERYTEGGNRLEDLVVTVDAAFPEGRDGDIARTVLPRALETVHARTCTVAGTIEAGKPITMRLA